MTRADCHSDHQYRALTLCRQDHDACPFGCAQDGAPNCDAHVRCIGLAAAQQCEPGRRTVSCDGEVFKSSEVRQKMSGGAND